MKLLANPKNLAKIGVLVLIVLFSSYEKYKVFDESGGDFEAYREAQESLLRGDSPYDYTVKSFETEDEELKHGYAYLPGLMYSQLPLYVLFKDSSIPIQRVLRAPLLVVDMGIAALIGAYLFKKNYLASVAGVLAWSYHPFFLIRGSYTNWEPYPVFFLLLALMLLGKKEALSALFFAIAVSFKIFPIILLPLFLLKVKNKWQFLLIGALVFYIISFPFMMFFDDFAVYLKGSIFVHGSRELQGRPVLSYLDYYSPINLKQVSLSSYYSYAAMLLAWASSIWLIIKKKQENKYILAMVAFFLFFLFSPVLNRTYLIWGIPFFILGTYEIFKTRTFYYLVSIALFYSFYAWYLSQWVRGFRFIGDTIYL